VGNWEDWEDWDENCLEGRRRRLMRRGTRTTREEGGEGERGEGREDESSCLWFVVEKALLFAVVAVWVVGFLRFVYLDRAIPVQRSTPGGHSLSRLPRRLFLRNRFFQRIPFDPLRLPMCQQIRREHENERLFRRRFLLVVVGIRCLFNFPSRPSHKQPKTTGTTEGT